MHFSLSSDNAHNLTNEYECMNEYHRISSVHTVQLLYWRKTLHRSNTASTEFYYNLFRHLDRCRQNLPVQAEASMPASSNHFTI